ncbi:DEAD/DEAH box helicase [Salinicoccus kekensis]|uniref:Helicase-like protein n=1 Tax=Salinicoccus kekensis TaxID=714307 RepID=A0A285UPQ5_9STAP|nr:DEAD/DEAH box helicase [Salinicoccus kekensis]SOC43802.1 helicase-like protein [Salinicoccus kekensis]
MFKPLKESQRIVNDYKEFMKTGRYIKHPFYNKLFAEALEQEEIGKGPYLEVTDSFTKGRSLNALIHEGVLNADYQLLNNSKHKAVHLNRPLYSHQEKAFEVIGTNNKSAVVTTGTGSGKTESFLYPILNELMNENAQGTLGPGVRALIVYPMNALANDQMKRFRELLANYPDITFGAYTGETKYKEESAINHYNAQYKSDPLENEIISREKMKESPPNILISNYAMLEYLLLRPGDEMFFSGPHSKEWKYIVLDEAHTYYGALGIEISMLLSRLKEAINTKDLNYILTSATLGDQKSVDDIVNYANNLTGSNSFDRESVIFSKREKIKGSPKIVDFPREIYKRINEGLKNASQEEHIRILKEELDYLDIPHREETVEELIFNLVTNDAFYFKIKNILAEKMSVKDITNTLNITDDDLQNFVDVASKAIKEGIKPFDARYHMFIKTIEGCYISFGKKPELKLSPSKTNKEGARYYQISICKYCGEIYLKGSIHNGIFIQSEEYESEYLLTNSIDGYKDNKDYKIFNIDTFSGKVIPINQITNNRFETDRTYHKYIVTKESEKNILFKCLSCTSSDTRSGITMDFYFPQMSSTSVIGSSLFESLPSSETKKVESNHSKGGFFKPIKKRTEVIKRPKQYLTFSDSRQQAARYASYFSYTYQNIFKKRLLMKALDIATTENPGQTEFKFHLIARILSGLIESKMKSEDQNFRPQKEAIKTLLYEYVSRDRNSLVQLGIIDMKINFSELLEMNEDLFIEGFTNKDKNDFFNYLLRPFIVNYAIEVPQEFQSQDLEDIFRVKKRQFVSNYSAGKIKGFISQHKNNKSTKMIRDLTKIETEDRIQEFLEGFFEFIKELKLEDWPLIINKDGEKYQLSNRDIKIKDMRNEDCYQCNSCHKIQYSSLTDYCINCHRFNVLNKTNPSQIQSNSHYYKIYTTNETVPMVIKEHTAQLSPDQARDYQNKFITKEINILSCSTTFEMGVDVGDLETVFMRNIPPSPANYIQRAGRAGRSSQAAAFSLTYSNLTSHDMNYFNNPESLIKGRISPPVFDRDNYKIAMRHANSLVIAAYFKKYPEFFTENKIDSFFNEEGISLFIDFIGDQKDILAKRIKEILPDALKKYSTEYVEQLVDEENSPILESYEKYKIELKELSELYDELVMKRKTGELMNVDKAMISLKSTGIIQYMSRSNIIPKYGFPVDTVELETSFTKDSNNTLRLSRDLSQAINEYAPDSEVIADGYIYKSRYINLPPKKNIGLPSYVYIKCSNEECKHLNIVKDQLKEKLSKCSLCKEELNEKQQKRLIIPEFGFTSEDRIEKATTKTPHRTKRSSVYYLEGKEKESYDKLSAYNIQMRSTKDDELAVINTSEFIICNECGYGLLDDRQAKKKSHKNKWGRDCEGSFSRKSLGHIFKTDVILLKLNIDLDFYDALGVLYALLDTMSANLGIERRDISGTVEYLGEKNKRTVRFVLYDKVPGGAGHVKRLYERTDAEVQEIFTRAYDKLSKCKCTEDTSCYSCLRNYENQHFHEHLTRIGALSALKSIMGNTTLI